MMDYSIGSRFESKISAPGVENHLLQYRVRVSTLEVQGWRFKVRVLFFCVLFPMGPPQCSSVSQSKLHHTVASRAHQSIVQNRVDWFDNEKTKNLQVLRCVHLRCAGLNRGQSVQCPVHRPVAPAVWLLFGPPSVPQLLRSTGRGIRPRTPGCPSGTRRGAAGAIGWRPSGARPPSHGRSSNAMAAEQARSNKSNPLINA